MITEKERENYDRFLNFENEMANYSNSVKTDNRYEYGVDHDLYFFVRFKNGFNQSKAKELRLKDYQVNNEWQKQIYLTASRFIDANNSEWFFIGGQSGSGKTMICDIISNELELKGRKVDKLSYVNFIQDIKMDIRTPDKISSVKDKIDYYCSVPVLFIDDFLKGYNDADLKYMLRIIHSRYEANKKTILSSELNIDEITCIDESMASRIVEKATKKNVITVTNNRNKNYRFK